MKFGRMLLGKREKKTLAFENHFAVPSEILNVYLEMESPSPEARQVCQSIGGQQYIPNL